MRFRILGAVEVFNGTRWIGIGAAKCRALAATLLIRADQAVSVDQLMFELWGDSPPSSATTQVYGYVMRLRRMLGDRDGRLVVTAAPGYRLAPGEQDVDALVFEARAAEGYEALRAGEPQHAAKLLADALKLWRGPALSDVPATELVRAETQRLAEERLTVLDSRIDADLECGRHATLIGELHRQVAENPLRERAWRQLMLALYRTGRQAEALLAFQRLRRILIGELGTEPGVDVQQVHQQILSGDPALAVPEPEGAEPESAGSEGAEPEDAESEGAGVVVSTQPPVCQLPADVPDFTGRAELLDDIVRMLANRIEDQPPPVAVVYGAPGIGKSTVAVRAARAAVSCFPDGQIYLDLAGTSQAPRDPSGLLADVLHALGVTGASVPEDRHAKASLYRSLLADRRMLLVLDDAADADQVRWLLPPNGCCAVLITSRGLLTALPGARHLELNLLEPWEAVALLARIAGPERVELEAEHATAIVRACGYLPLAIRIAGGRLLGRPTWSLRQLRERFEDESTRLSELRLGDLGVRSSFDLSMRQLPADAVRAFRLLGLLGPQTQPGWVVGPLLGRVRADTVLDTLVDANLLRLTASDCAGQPRYRLHDLLSAYAVEGAQAIPLPVRRDAITRVLAAWLDLVGRAGSRLPPGLFRPPRSDSPRWTTPDEVGRRLAEDPLRWFEAERQALLGAVQLAVDWEMPEPAWQLAVAGAPYYDLHCRYEDWQRGHHLALTAVRAAGGDPGEAVLLRGLAQVQIYRDDYRAATKNMRRSLRLFQTLGDRLGEGLATAGLGTIDRLQARHKAALGRFRRALELVTAAGDRSVEAQLHASIGRALLALGRRREAAGWFDEALVLCRASGDEHREAVVLREASQLHGDTDPHVALRCLQRALDIFVGLGDERCISYTLLKVGQIHVLQGDRPRAISTLTRAASTFRNHGDRTNEARCWQFLGELESARHNTTAAIRYLTWTLELWRSIGAASQVAKTRATLRTLRASVGHTATDEGLHPCAWRGRSPFAVFTQND